MFPHKDIAIKLAEVGGDGNKSSNLPVKTPPSLSSSSFSRLGFACFLRDILTLSQQGSLKLFSEMMRKT